MDKHIKFVNGELQNGSEIPLIKDTGQGALCPLGSIISLHPNAIDIINFLDTDFWRVCNGGTVTITKEDGTTIAGFSVPDLTDDRFLMGGSGNSTETGGGNDGHFHSVENIAGSVAGTVGEMNPGSPLSSHTHDLNDASGTEDTDTFPNQQFVLKGKTIAIPVTSLSDASHTHAITFTGTVGTGAADGEISGSNIPLHFKVLYYMRIK